MRLKKTNKIVALQNTALLCSTRILRKVLEIGRKLFLLKLKKITLRIKVKAIHDSSVL